MTDRFDVSQGPACGADNNATQHADGLEPNPGAEAPLVDGSAPPGRVQAAPTTTNYRRSLFRR